MFQAPKGTRDVLPPESANWQAAVASFATVVGRAGYGLLLSPMFEDMGVFQRLGESTDVVRKEMYDFQDKGDRHMALRPEGTASVVRAFNQHRPTVPWKVWYVTPCFRYEEPQSGRYRQHHQVGVEAIGSSDPDMDVEVIALQHDFYRSLGLRRLTLRLNSMGSAEDRQAYAQRLSEWLSERIGDLDEADRANAARNPLRVLDSKRHRTRSVTAEAPSIADHLSPDAQERFARVQAGLHALDVPYELEPQLVRGLDYYTHTIWEYASDVLSSAHDAVGGGGRYDGLAESLGGGPAPGVGFGSGLERLLMVCQANAGNGDDVPDGLLDVFVVDVTGGDAGRDLSFELRRAGIAVDRAFDGRSMKAQMKVADRSGARLALLIGPDELAAGSVTVRDLRADTPQTTLARDDVTTAVATLLADAATEQPLGSTRPQAQEQ